MWHEDLEPGRPWSALWYDYIICRCGAIRLTKGTCPVCSREISDAGFQALHLADGGEVSTNSFQGAEGRFEDYMYLDLLEREWKRPVTNGDQVRAFDPSRRPSPRAVIVVQFWSYFETRIERLLRAGMRNLPPRVTEDLLTRYTSIGSRLERLYRILFNATYRDDLNELGLSQVAEHLAVVQKCRNAFAHGEPEAIDDALVTAVVENLKNEHEAWIAVFNRRAVH